MKKIWSLLGFILLLPIMVFADGVENYELFRKKSL